MSQPQRRPWIWIAASAVVVALLGVAIYFARNWPFTQAALTKTLEERFQRQVVVGGFRETWFPPGCVANDVKFLHRRRKDLPPLFSAQNLIVQSSWTGLLRRRIAVIRVIGLRMTVPPADASGKSPVMPITDPNSKASTVDRIEANDAILEFLPKQPAGGHIMMRIHQIVLNHVNSSTPVSFQAALKTDKPDGELTAVGTVGPWDKDEPAATRISGKYQYANANLKGFKDLGGMLTSQGDFNGVLSKINVAGSLDVPGFHVDGSAHNSHLTGQFKAAVDSHSADVVIDQALGRVGRTTILAVGNISGGKGTEGKTARIELTVNTGRVEDLLNYFSSQKVAAMTGAVKLKAYVEVPPGPGFLKKIRLNGDFGVAGSKLTKASRQSPINHLERELPGARRSRSRTKTLARCCPI